MPRLSDLIAPSFYDLHWDIKDELYTHYWIKGGRGSTKSSFTSVEIIRGMMADVNANALCIRKIANELKDSVLEQLLWAIDKLEVGHLWKHKLSPMELIYLPTGQKILFRGADKPKKLKSTKVAKGYIKYIWYEECDEFNGMAEIRTINQSLIRGGEHTQVFYTYNPPISRNNWVNEEVMVPAKNKRVHESTYLSVPVAWLGEQFIEDAEDLKQRNERAYKHEYLGEAIGTGGNVFENLDIREIPDDEIATFDRIYRGIDWGWYPDYNRYVEMYYSVPKRELYIYGELSAQKASNEGWYQMLIDYGVTSADTITADSAEKKSISDLYQFGLKHIKPAIKGPKSVDMGLKWLQALNKITIDPKRCPYTSGEFMRYEYERNKNGEIITGYPDKDNHSIDATRYALEDVWRRKGL